MRYREAQSPEQFLEHVLLNWKSFRKQNAGICKAIQDLLGKVKKLEEERDSK